MKNPNGYGTVYKMHGRRRRPYIAAVTITTDGKRTRKALGYYASRREALTALAEYHNKPYDLSAREITVKDFFTKWIAWREERAKGQSANIIHRSIFNKHCKPLHDWRFVDVQSIHIQQLVDNAPTPITALRIKQLWGLFYKYAALLGLTNHNAASIIESPKRPKSTLHKPFSDEKLAELWNHTDDMAAKLALIYCYTGLRPMELVTIKIENVHLNERYMIGGMKTDAGKMRTIPIAEKILPLIKSLCDQGIGRLTTFETYQGLLHTWKKSPIPAVKAHLPHDGRHTCETMLDNARVAKRTIQLIIGHVGADVDDAVYTHKTRQQLIDAINQI